MSVWTVDSRHGPRSRPPWSIRQMEVEGRSGRGISRAMADVYELCVCVCVCVVPLSPDDDPVPTEPAAAEPSTSQPQKTEEKSEKTADQPDASKVHRLHTVIHTDQILNGDFENGFHPPITQSCLFNSVYFIQPDITNRCSVYPKTSPSSTSSPADSALTIRLLKIYVHALFCSL